MTLKRLVWAGGSTALAVAAMAAGALGAHRSGAGLAFSYVVHNTGVEYVTSAGRTSSFPGRLDTGDQIFARDTLSQGGTRIGYDNEACTVTFDGNDLCRVVSVFPGRGEVEASWLWVGRNASRNGPSRFNGVVDGGTGAFQNARGQFLGTVLPDGTLRFTAQLD